MMAVIRTKVVTVRTAKEIEEIKRCKKKKAESIRLYNLNVGSKYEGQMEDDVQIFSLGNELVMSGTDH